MRLWADRLALAYAALVVVYWLLPQSLLDGAATQRGQLFAARHDLILNYFLGPKDSRRQAETVSDDACR